MNTSHLAHRSIDAGAAAVSLDIDLDRFEHWLDDHADAAAWPCQADSVRAQLASVLHRLPPPPGRTARPQVLSAVASTARQIERLTRRAEAAEAQVRRLRAQIAAEQQGFDALGRRFGRAPHESFLAFVTRLGMTAKAMTALRAKPGTTPER